MVTSIEFNGDRFSHFVKAIFMVTFCDIYGDANDLTQSNIVYLRKPEFSSKRS